MRKFFFAFLLTILHCGLSMATEYEYVDLGLTSKTLWATCNVGASVPEEYGNYYAWGETETKQSFTWSNYIYCGGTEKSVYDIGDNIVSTSYDVAKKVMGEEWCMPSVEQIEELVKECTFDLRSLNGVVGYKVDGPNGNYIFMPFCGDKYNTIYEDKAYMGYYWSGGADVENNVKSRATVLCFQRITKTAYSSTLRRRTGITVRAVKKASSDPSQETETTTSYVDLGLSVKWASYNLGAEKPSDTGGLYAWGEKSTKSSYTWANYVYANGTASSVKNIGTEISGTDYDVATAILGSQWRMPTKDEINELLSKCTFTAATVDGVAGYTVKGPNGNTIFLPLTGYSYDGKLRNQGVSVYYASGSLSTDPQRAHSLYLKSDGKTLSTCARRTGLVIRPVYQESSSPAVNPPEETQTELWKGEWVDLGLSVMWATSNFGAQSATDTGLSFAWGETKTKNDFTWSNYEHANGTSSSVKDIGTDITATQYDPVRQWQDPEEDDVWRMPTKSEFEELITKCTFTETTIDGVKGCTVTGPNGNSIFLPYVGCKYDGKTAGVGSSAYYWSGMLYSSKERATSLYINSGGLTMSSCARRTGVVIRPVYSMDEPNEGEPGENDPVVNPDPAENNWNCDAVDLGLSVKWASCNFGAEEESDFGDMYAWGETTTKSDFTWRNYMYADGTATSVQNIGSDISNTEYDAVALSQSSNEGDIWRMPTKAEIQELKSKCSFVVVSKNGVKGIKATGPNGNSIFFPFGGCMYDGNMSGKNTSVYLWSSTLYTNSQRAYTLYLGSSISVSSCARRTGIYIRPVCGDGSGGEQIIDPDPGTPGSGPGPLLPDPYFANSSSFDADGIEQLGINQDSETDIYSLSGVKVDASNLMPGVYVRNGKKFVVK